MSSCKKDEDNVKKEKDIKEKQPEIDKKKETVSVRAKNVMGKYVEELRKRVPAKGFEVKDIKSLFKYISAENISKYLKNMADSAPKTDRRMKYPYTYTAKFAQFPYKYYINNAWLTKHYLIAVVACIPIFYKIGQLSYAPENVRTWEEIRRKQFEPGPHH